MDYVKFRNINHCNDIIFIYLFMRLTIPGLQNIKHIVNTLAGSINHEGEGSIGDVSHHTFLKRVFLTRVSRDLWEDWASASFIATGGKNTLIQIAR